VWLLISAAVLFPLIQLRSLSDAGLVAYIGVGTIGVVNLIIIGHAIFDLIHNNRPKDYTPANMYPDSFMDFINGLTQLAFAYGGHVLMVDIQSVMARPQDWPKAIYSSQIFMFANYAIVGCVPWQEAAGLYGVLCRVTIHAAG
jgi:amino acid permease